MPRQGAEARVLTPEGDEASPQLREVTPLPPDELGEDIEELSDADIVRLAVRPTPPVTPAEREKRVQKALGEIRARPDAPRPDTEWEREVEIQDDEDIVAYIKKMGAERKEIEIDEDGEEIHPLAKGVEDQIDKETADLVERVEHWTKILGKRTWGEFDKVGIHDRFALLGVVVGEGGMGSVQIGIDKKTMQLIAIKGILIKDREEKRAEQIRVEKERLVARLKREIELHDKVSEVEYMVRPLDVVDLPEEEGGFGLVMPFIDGTDLERYTHDKGKKEIGDPRKREILVGKVMLQLCVALRGMEKNKVFHRDIKPDNIMLVNRPDGKVEIRLIDLGFSKEDHEIIDFGTDLESDEISEEEPGSRPLTADMFKQRAVKPKRAEPKPGLTPTGMFVGTLGYAAPELLRPKMFTGEERPRTTTQTELYSVGATMYAALSNHYPVSSNMIGFGIRKNVNVWENIVPPSVGYTENGQGHLDEVALALLADKPKERVGSYKDFAELLGGALLKFFPEIKDDIKGDLAKAGAKGDLVEKYDRWIARKEADKKSHEDVMSILSRYSK